jgi:alpha-L-rhamnosidase
MFFAVLVGVTVVASGDPLPAPTNVRIDYYQVSNTKDLVIGTGRPRFSWSLPVSQGRDVRQVAYQIQIRSKQWRWDSTRVPSDRSIHVPYTNAVDLQPWQRYDVRVRLWTTLSDQATSWTSWMSFRTVLSDLNEYLNQYNDNLFWIGSNQIYMNELRKEFNVSIDSHIRSAIVMMSGIGYYELYLNGQKVDESRKLDPGWTTYEKRTLYVSYDFTSTLKVGWNAIGVKLGNGWYSPEQYLPPSETEPNYGLFVNSATTDSCHLLSSCRTATAAVYTSYSV